MATFYRNDIGIGYLRISFKELVDYSENLSPICDECLESFTEPDDIYLVPILNEAFCRCCAKIRLDRIVDYPEDMERRQNKYILDTLFEGRDLKENNLLKVDTINVIINYLKEQGISRKGISDGYHTFGDLYYHRMVLFSIICNQNKELAWKSKQHDDGTMFDDSFIVGISTPEGQYTYHYHLKYWDNFNVRELEYAPEYDGHKPEDITRLLSIM